jgi:hypothetical protein
MMLREVRVLVHADGEDTPAVDCLTAHPGAPSDVLPFLDPGFAPAVGRPQQRPLLIQRCLRFWIGRYLALSNQARNAHVEQWLVSNSGTVLGCTWLHEVVEVFKLSRPFSDGEALVSKIRGSRVGVTCTHDLSSRDL